MKQYTKSSFKYWFAHWCAYQMTALNLGVWKFKFLLHDIEKPFLKPILGYSRMNKLHKKYARHHIRPNKKYDILAAIVDFECSRYTKLDSPLTAYEVLKERHPEEFEKYTYLLKKLDLYEH